MLGYETSITSHYHRMLSSRTSRECGRATENTQHQLHYIVYSIPDIILVVHFCPKTDTVPAVRIFQAQWMRVLTPFLQ